MSGGLAPTVLRARRAGLVRCVQAAQRLKPPGWSVLFGSPCLLTKAGLSVCDFFLPQSYSDFFKAEEEGRGWNVCDNHLHSVCEDENLLIVLIPGEL